MGATPRTQPTNELAPRNAWPAILRDVTVEVFFMMVGAMVLTPETGDHMVRSEVTGMVGIAGPLSATLSLRCSVDSATRIASQMLGVPLDEAAAQKCDAIGEVCNMVAGSFKEKIGLGGECMLSLPTVLTGKNYQIRSRSLYLRVELPVLYENEPIWIALDIRQIGSGVEAKAE
jgi:chemotaxis protein CheX